MLGREEVHAQKTFMSFCAEIFAKKGQCPVESCMLSCANPEADKEGCTLACFPQDCKDIVVDKCPLEFCSVMTNCSENLVCHYKMLGEQPKCGDLSYAGQAVECCPGLVRRCGVEFFDGTCDMEGKNSVYDIPICIPCGDGTCSNFETRCNCPEDCMPEDPRL